jgi:hypothetical protein
MKTFTMILLFYTALASTISNCQNLNEPSSTTYDYVILGCGIGGLVVASRLSENPEISVLCVEAGPL